MKFRQRILGATALLALMCSAAHAEVKIGMAGPLSGSNAAFGEQMRRGAEQAVKDINAKGGINNEQVVLVTGDDACDPKQAVAVANTLVGEDVAFVVGHFCSGSSIPASEVYAEEGIPMISPASTNPALTEAGKENVFRVCGRDDAQGKVAADWIKTHFADKKVAILHDKTAYGLGLAQETQKALNAAGITEVVFSDYTPGERDYSAVVTRLKSLGAEVLYLGGYYPEAGLMSRQLKEQGVSLQMISGDALVTDEFWAITQDTGEGTLMTFGPDARTNPDAADAVKSFRDAGYEPEGYTLYSYAAVQIFAEAAKKAGSVDKAEVIEALHDGTTYRTVIGPITFNEKGDVTENAYVMYQWHDGKYAEVK